MARFVCVAVVICICVVVVMVVVVVVVVVAIAVVVVVVLVVAVVVVVAVGVVVVAGAVVISGGPSAQGPRVVAFLGAREVVNDRWELAIGLTDGSGFQQATAPIVVDVWGRAPVPVPVPVQPRRCLCQRVAVAGNRKVDVAVAAIQLHLRAQRTYFPCPRGGPSSDASLPVPGGHAGQGSVNCAWKTTFSNVGS